MNLRIWMIVLVSPFLFAAPPQPPPKMTLLAFPRISASTAYQPLVMQLLPHWTGLEVMAGPAVGSLPGERFWVPRDPSDRKWQQTDAKGMPLIERVAHHKTHAAGLKVIDGSVDMALIPDPGPELLAAAEKAGVKLEATPVASEALIFVVSSRNPNRQVRSGPLRALYAGQPATWRDLHPDGNELPVVPYVRNATSGSHVLFRSLVMGETPVSPTLREQRLHHTMGGILDSVGDNPQALGYTIFTYHQGMARIEPQLPSKSMRKAYAPSPEPTRPLAVDGVMPTLDSIADGSYPYRAPIVALIRADLPEGHPARRIRDWMTTPEGQAWVAKSGFPPGKPQTQTQE